MPCIFFMKLTEELGDALNISNTPTLVLHCCNDIGLWGRGFVMEISNKFGAKVQNEYRKF